MKPRPEHDDGTTQISMRIGNWVFHCKVDANRQGHSGLLVLNAIEPSDDDLERYSYGSTTLGESFKAKAFLPRDQVPKTRGTEALESHLRKSYLEEETPGLPGSFESWSRVLDAREEFVRGNLKPIKFSKSKLNNGAALFTIEGNFEGEVMDTAWDIKGFKNVFFEVEGFDGVELWTRPSRELKSLPENGELITSLGKDAVSLRRQRKAVDDFKNGLAVSSAIGETVENPEESSQSSGVRQIVTVLGELDNDKIQAVGSALSSPDVFVVQGPPGTGKTSFIAEYVHQIRLDNPDAKILLVAQTHVAVDNALLRLDKNGVSGLVRIGDAKDSRINKDVKKFIVEVKIGEWVENIRENSDDNLADRAGIQPSQLDKLRVLSLLFELQAARKQRSFLRSRQAQTTTALEESLTSDEPSKVDIAISRTETLIDTLRVKLTSLAPGISDLERNGSEQEFEIVVAKLSSEFDDSRNLVSLLKLQTDWLLKIHTDADLRAKYLRQASVVAGTCIGFLRETAVRDFEFDFCIIDEASKATATETLVPMSMAKHVVLVGDDRQLPPNDEELLESAEILLNHGLTQADVATTLFTSLKDRLPVGKTSTLRTQWRMTKAIGNLISYCFYDGELISPSTETISGYESLFGKPVIWLDTSKVSKRFETNILGGGYSNWVEANEIAAQLVRLAKRIKSRHLHIDNRQPGILIVSPYRAQRKAILEQVRRQDQELLNSIDWRIETADAVQGTEADIVIVATTRSNSSGKLGFLGMAHWRRINVALSRARFGLVIVGDSSFMETTRGPLTKVLEYIRHNQEECDVLEVEG
jgi:superfamily I DNA and/or RNA helicase